MLLDLTDDETHALAQLLQRTIDEDRYPMLPRLAPYGRAAVICNHRSKPSCQATVAMNSYNVAPMAVRIRERM
jgi:hypothetical protein